jgi:hypothetical protein
VAKPFAYRRSVVDRPGVAVVAYCDCIDGVDDLFSAFTSPFDCCPDIACGTWVSYRRGTSGLSPSALCTRIVLVAMCVDVKVGYLSGPS